MLYLDFINIKTHMRYGNKMNILSVISLVSMAFATAEDNAQLSVDDCQDGEYLDEWNNQCKTCGQCKNDVNCDKVTALCPDGCQIWFYPHDHCWGYIKAHDVGLTLAHITDGPEVKEIRSDRVEVCFYQNETLVKKESAQYYGYLIQYTTAESNDYIDDVDFIPVQTELLIHKDVIGLTPNVEYKFRIVLLRVFEESVYETLDTTVASLGRTLCAAPERPYLRQATPLPSLTAVYIEWELGSHHCDYYKRVEVYYSPINGTSKKMYLQESQNTVTIYGLTRGFSYIIYVRVMNNEDALAYSEQVWINLIPEVLGQQTTVMPGSQKGGDEEQDDRKFYIALAVAVVGVVLALIALLVAIVLFLWLKDIGKGSPSTAPQSASRPNQGERNGASLPPLPSRDPSVPGSNYEHLGPRSDCTPYNDLTARQYDNSNNPTYDVL